MGRPGARGCGLAGVGVPPKGSMWGAAQPQGLSGRAPRCMPQEVRMYTGRSEGARACLRLHVCYRDTDVHVYTGMGGCTLVPLCPQQARGLGHETPSASPTQGGDTHGCFTCPPQPIPLAKQPQGPHASQALELHHPPQLRGVPMHCSPTRDPQLLGGGCRGQSPAPGKGHQGCGPPLGEGNRAWVPPCGEGDRA